MSWRCPDCGMTSAAKAHKAHRHTRFANKYNKIQPVDASWLAAAIDFESSIGMYRSRNTWIIVLQMGVTDRELADRMLSIIGGGRINHYIPKGEHCNGVWRYSLNSNGLRVVIPQVFPFIIAKKRQFELILHALELTDTNRGIGHYSSNHDELMRVKEELTTLNKRGR